MEYSKKNLMKMEYNIYYVECSLLYYSNMEHVVLSVS